MKALSPRQWEARAEAYNEAAEHLFQHWTDDPIEIEQGKIVKKLLEKEAILCTGKGTLRKRHMRPREGVEV